jgi:hypothetical protein
MTPLLLMLNPAGALDSVNVHGGLAQVNATATFTAAPIVVVCAAGVVTVGLATMFQVNPAVLAETPELSVMRTVTLLKVWADVGTVPVITPLLLMLNPVGALVNTYAQGAFGQVDATVRLTAAPTVVVCGPGVVTVGAATTVQVNEPVLAVTFDLSVTVTEAVNTCGALVIVPVMTPLLLTLNPAGPLFRT